MDPCIVDYSVEIPTRCSFVIEFIISKYIEASTCFERHTAHHQELQNVFAASVYPCGDRSLPFSTQPWQRPARHGYINQMLQIQF